LKIEMLNPSSEAVHSALQNGTEVPRPMFTEPHTRLHLEWGVPKAYAGIEIGVAKAWGIVGEVGGVDAPGGTYVYEVTDVYYNYAGNPVVTYTVVTPSGGIYTVGPTTLNGIELSIARVRQSSRNWLRRTLGQ
jgi:hypothetical protein